MPSTRIWANMVLGRHLVERKIMTIYVRPVINQQNVLNPTADHLYRWDDIQTALVDLKFNGLISPLFDKLTGHPNGNDKTVGELYQPTYDEELMNKKKDEHEQVGQMFDLDY